MALSQQEFDKLKSRLSSPSGVAPITENNKGYSFGETMQDIKQAGSNLVNTAKETFAKTQEAKRASRSGEQGMLRGFAQQAGIGLGGVAKATGDLFTGAGKVALSDDGEYAFKKGLSDTVPPVVKSVMENDFVKSMGDKYNALDDAQKRDIDAVLGLGSFLTELSGGVVKKPIQTAVKTTMNVADDVIRAGVRGASDLASNVNPTRVGETITDIITPIERGVETVLNPTSMIPKDRLVNIPIDSIKAVTETKNAKFQIYLKQAEKAVESNYQKTPLTLAGDKATEAVIVIQNKINKQNLLKKEALGKTGDRVISNMDDVRKTFNTELQDRVGVVINVGEDGVPTLTNAIGRKSKVAFDPADNKLITDANRILQDLGNKPTVREIDDTVDALQDLLYKREGLTAVPVNSQVQGVLKNITGKLNNSVKKIAGEQYRKSNAKMKYMIDTFNTLNKSLGKEGERGASLMKSLFSPSGEKPRRLFTEIKKLTGIDLTEEATIAKFVMENVGDARQSSLLEEVIRGRTLSPTGLIEKAFEKTIGKLQNPIDKAQRIIKKPLK